MFWIYGCGRLDCDLNKRSFLPKMTHTHYPAPLHSSPEFLATYLTTAPIFADS